MSENTQMSKRTPLHRRNIDVQGYLRDDGLWEVEGVLQDTKGYDISLKDRPSIPQGDFLHHLTLSWVFDSEFRIVDVRCSMMDTPYKDCPGAEPQYKALIGIQIKKGWLDEARKAIGRTTGCTHLTEMLPVLATAALQTVRGYRLHNDPGYIAGSEERKGMLSSCHGFRVGGRAQKYLWPKLDE